ncbi:MAG: FG-GAP repeat protein [Phycisphaerae bacterium]
MNDTRGLEHGYTVRQRPAGSAGFLQFSLAVRGDLRPRLSGDGRGVTFVDTNGAAVVNYAGLTVFDATGAKVPAWFDAPTPTAGGLQPAAFSIVVDDREATYPLTIDPTAQQAYLKASNTEANDQFGYSVAVSGDTVVVGAYQEDSNATGVNGNQANNLLSSAGAAYVFVRSGAVWSQQAYLKASNTGAGDRFGISVAASGDTVVIGASLEASSATGVDGNGTDNSAANAGAAYVFVRSAGVWSQQAYLKASNTEANDQFGRSVGRWHGRTLSNSGDALDLRKPCGCHCSVSSAFRPRENFAAFERD